VNIHNADNLETLRALIAAGERFDLVELDGPYGAGLEAWDSLTDAEYVEHYAARLALVRQVLQPWGVCYLFGYPEMVALVRAWAQQTEALHLRRWLTWYVQQTTHAGRRVQAVGVFIRPESDSLLTEWRTWLKERRLQMNLSLRDVRRLTGINAHLLSNPRASSGGYFWYEAECAGYPTRADYATIKRHMGTPGRFDVLCELQAFEGLTSLDYITVPVERAAELNDAGLRSKPIGLYDTLFRPAPRPSDAPRALILYGGSGNAAIAAGRLGYAVDICETDPARCALIRRRYAWGVERRDETPVEDLGPLFQVQL
jgi:hypothetical protein